MGFYLETKGLRALPYKNMFHNAITFELSLSEMQYRRHVYSILDFFGDIGGLYGALFPICQILVIILQYKGSHLFLMSELFSQDHDYTEKSRNTLRRGISLFNNNEFSVVKELRENV